MVLDLEVKGNEDMEDVEYDILVIMVKKDMEDVEEDIIVTKSQRRHVECPDGHTQLSRRTISRLSR